MSRNITNISAAISAALGLASVEAFDASVAAARAVKAEERSKDQKLAIIADDLTKTATRFYNVQNDIVVVREGKPVYEPAVGDAVIATVGRNTATSQAKLVEGTVVAVKKPAEGEKGATQVRVRIYAGTFDEQLVTLYPANLTKKEAEVVAG